MTDVDPRGTRVIVADDDVLMREGLASLLERGGYEVVGQAGDGSELMRLFGEQQTCSGGRRYPHASRPSDGGRSRPRRLIREGIPARRRS